MNRIKIIKSNAKQITSLQKSSDRTEIKTRSDSVKAVSGWIREWREKKLNDEETNKAALLKFKAAADFRAC